MDGWQLWRNGFFLLRVEIVDHSGNSLYQSKGSRHKDIGSYHLTIIRLEEDGQSSVRQSMLHSRTQLVLPGNLSFNLRTETPYHPFYQGRSEWSNILTDAFGSSFHQLLEPRIILLFARVLYSTLYVDDREFAECRMNPWGDALFINDRVQHQHRFMQMLGFAAARLPELIEVKKYGKDHILELDDLDLNRVKIARPSASAPSVAFKMYFGFSPETVKDKLIASGYSTALVDACSCSDCKAAGTADVPSDFY